MTTPSGTPTPEELAKLKKRFTAQPIPPCRVCNKPLRLQAAEAGKITWGCDSTQSNQHYQNSIFIDYSCGGDAEVLALIDSFATLRADRDRLREACERISAVELGEQQPTEAHWPARLMQGLARQALQSTGGA